MQRCFVSDHNSLDTFLIFCHGAQLCRLNSGYLCFAEVGICRDCRMAIDPEKSVMEPCSSGLEDITQGIENVTLVSQQKYFYTHVILYAWCLVIIRSYLQFQTKGTVGEW